jgi:hypothetical protein
LELIEGVLVEVAASAPNPGQGKVVFVFACRANEQQGFDAVCVVILNVNTLGDSPAENPREFSAIKHSVIANLSTVAIALIISSKKICAATQNVF